MQGGVAVSYRPHPAMPQVGCGYHYLRAPFRVSGGPAGGGGGPGADRNVHGTSPRVQQSSRILENILCMKQDRLALVPSPPGGGQGYVMIPSSREEDPYSPQSRYPTPPSSYSSSPEPCPLQPQETGPHRLSPPLAALSSPEGHPHPQSTSSDRCPSSLGGSPTMGVSVNCYQGYGVSPASPHRRGSSPHRRRGSSSSQGSCSSAERVSCGQGVSCHTDSCPPSPQHHSEQPMNLKKRPRSPSPSPCPRTDRPDDGEQPMDLSCPKKVRLTDPDHVRHRARRGSAATTASSLNRTRVNVLYCAEEVASRNESILKSILCGELVSRAPSPTCPEAGDEVRTDSPFMYSLSTSHGLTRSPNDRVSELIARAKRRAAANRSTPPTGSEGNPLPASRQTATPAETVTVTGSPVPAMSRDTVVSLAKKNLLPVSARISDWLVKVVQYVKTLPEFATLPNDDKVALLQGAWSRLLLLYMAENHFQFAVNPCTCPAPKTSADVSGSGSAVTSGSLTSGAPTLEAVESITGFIRKCEALAVGPEEMNYLKLLTLFNPSHVVVESPSYIENVNAYVRKCLQETCAVRSPGRAGKVRYSQLLLCLPPLFGVRPAVMEALFCQHITANTDMDLLLKEMLHKL